MKSKVDVQLYQSFIIEVEIFYFKHEMEMAENKIYIKSHAGLDDWLEKSVA